MTRSTRMLWGMCWMLAVVPVVSACDGGPSAPTVKQGTRDLDFVLPAVQPRATEAGNVGEWTEGKARLEEALRSGFAAARGGSGDTGGTGGTGGTSGGTAQASIYDSYVSAYFGGDVLHYEYGMTAYGTGYRITPSVRLSSGGGSAAQHIAGGGMRVNLGGVPVWSSPRNRESVRTSVDCGQSAQVTVDFAAFIALGGDAYGVVADASKRGSADASQQGCAPSTGGSGGGGDGGDLSGSYAYTICYYDVWVDAWGRVILFEVISCHRFTVYAQ